MKARADGGPGTATSLASAATFLIFYDPTSGRPFAKPLKYTSKYVPSTRRSPETGSSSSPTTSSPASTGRKKKPKGIASDPRPTGHHPKIRICFFCACVCVCVCYVWMRGGAITLRAAAVMMMTAAMMTMRRSFTKRATTASRHSASATKRVGGGENAI